MSEELIDNLNKFDLAKVLTKVLKFCDSFEFAYGGYSESNFFEYFQFNGKKRTHVYGDFADLVDNEDYDEAYTDLENSIRFEGELSSEFLDGVNDIISEGNSYGLAFYDLKGNKID